MALLDEIGRTGALAPAAARTGIPLPLAERTAEQMADAGVLVDRGTTRASKPTGRAPIEGRLLAARLDLINAAGAARRLDGLARLLFTRPAVWLWALLMVAAVVSVLATSAITPVESRVWPMEATVMPRPMSDPISQFVANARVVL
ncbi:MAG: hypothetical protein AAF264_06610, partial [Pseudomonadota bacterium]